MDAATIAALIEAGGKVAGGISAGRASGRQAENTDTGNFDRTAVQRYQAEQQAKINAALLTENATKDRADRVLTDSKTRAQQVGLGELLQSMGQVQLDLPPGIPRFKVSGLGGPGPLTRQAGGNLARSALEAQMSGSDIPDLPDVSGIGTAAPAQTPLAQANGLDTFLNYAGAAGAGLGTYDEVRKAQAEAQAKQEAARQGGRPTLSAQQNRVPGADSSIVPNAAPQGNVPQLQQTQLAQQDPATLMKILQMMGNSGSRG